MAERYNYTGKLTDIGLVPFTSNLRLQVRPERETSTDEGLLSSIPVNVNVTPDGDFLMQLVPSVDTSPQVRYVISLLLPVGPTTSFTHTDVWTFTAAPGGGEIGGMVGEPISRLYFGTTPPAEVPGLIWVDTSNPLRFRIYEWEEEVA